MEVELKASNFSLNFRITKNYIITYDLNLLKLFDLNGYLLDYIKFSEIIINIEIINNNYIIVQLCFSIIIMKINYGLFIFLNTKKFWEIINNIIFIKSKNLLVLSLENNITIFDINNINDIPIQVIYNKSDSCLNLNENIFISYNYEYISFYKNVIGTKIYKLLSKLKLH